MKKEVNCDGSVNGQRPPPLRTGKDSHSIQKPATAARRQPVIIYTHPPKVIRAAPNDFMKLVQRLTGLSSGDDGSPPAPAQAEDVLSGEENSCETAETKPDPAMYEMSNEYLVEAAGSGDFFCSPRTSAVFESAVAATAISPSIVEYMKMYPDYL
ncbi:VQ motif-containing protein 20-like [Salvia splendens]|uniref:VQ motif-containing protein 20-like n=1 Tax=Salvia splendens TaxID=180675 RepID=UPI001C266C8E|nr:VQ motif-containing protein 20-like [Salvia splendens]